jgi:transposase
MDARLRELEVENADLRAEVSRLHATVDSLRATVDKLTAALEAAQRAGKRQAAPFRNGDGPAVEPKKPGRKKGRRHGRHEHRAIPAPLLERL